MLACHGCRLKLGARLDEVVLLSTCNRVEIYGTTPWVNGNVHGILRHLGGGDTDYSPYLYVKEGDEAVKHLFQVAGGLDSMVVGETEITGQVKNAYQTAQDAKLTGRVLNRLFQTAFARSAEVIEERREGNPHPHQRGPRRGVRRQRGGGTGGKSL